MCVWEREGENACVRVVCVCVCVSSSGFLSFWLAGDWPTADAGLRCLCRHQGSRCQGERWHHQIRGTRFDICTERLQLAFWKQVLSNSWKIYENHAQGISFKLLPCFYFQFHSLVSLVTDTRTGYTQPPQVSEEARRDARTASLISGTELRAHFARGTLLVWQSSIFMPTFCQAPDSNTT